MYDRDLNVRIYYNPDEGLIISMGDGVKKVSASEKKNIIVARKSIVAKTNINIGDKFSNKNIDVKRPATGLSPMLWDDIVGKKSRYNFKKDDLIKL